MTLSNYDRDNFERILNGHGDWFTAYLLRLIAKANPRNRELLRKGFPREVEAFETWQRLPYSPNLPRDVYASSDAQGYIAPGEQRHSRRELPDE